MEKMNYRTITKSEHISDARHLLWNCYVQEWDWLPPYPNPIGQKVVVGDRHELVDNLDGEAIWIGAFENNILAACCRIIYRDSLEITKFKKIDTKDCVEINRIAVHKEYRNTDIILKLLAYACRTSTIFGEFFIGGIASSKLESIVVKGGGVKVGMIRYYEGEDDVPIYYGSLKAYADSMDAISKNRCKL